MYNPSLHFNCNKTSSFCLLLSSLGAQLVVVKGKMSRRDLAISTLFIITQGSPQKKSFTTFVPLKPKGR